MFKLLNTETKQVVEFTTKELLDELNRDRSEEWSEYTEDSTISEIEDGIDHFTEYDRSW